MTIKNTSEKLLLKRNEVYTELNVLTNESLLSLKELHLDLILRIIKNFKTELTLECKTYINDIFKKFDEEIIFDSIMPLTGLASKIDSKKVYKYLVEKEKEIDLKSQNDLILFKKRKILKEARRCLNISKTEFTNLLFSIVLDEDHKGIYIEVKIDEILGAQII